MNKQKKMKIKVKQSFDLGSITYDEFSDVQQEVGQFLIDFFFKSFSKKKNNHIFKNPISFVDLGCGTGDFSQKIMSKFLINSLRLVDISSEMIKCSRKKINEKKAEFLVCDFDKYFEFERFNLIVSNMALHWSFDINNLLSKIILNMNKGSFFLFSVPNNNSFRNFKKIMPIDNKNNLFNDFPKDDIILSLKKNESINVFTKKIKIFRKYLHPLHFLREMRKLGVTAKINREQQNLFFLKNIAKKEFFLDYNISLFLVKKNEP